MSGVCKKSVNQSLQWIDVQHELPDADTVVLVAMSGDEPVWLAYYDDSDYPIWRSVDGSMVGGVTHWMELPERPE